MEAITIKEFGGPELLIITSNPDPQPAPEEVLVDVHATALNRADILQRQGKYPPPPGASNILGLEIAGLVNRVGSNETNWKSGDKVFGLIPGGGYAEKAVIHRDMLMKIPEGYSFEEATAIPEVFLTAYQSLFWLANLKNRESILIHAGASGVGTAAIQLAKSLDATIFATASKGKHQSCLDLGANFMYDYHSGPFEEWVLKNSDNRGVNVIIDFIGDGYFTQNINCLARDGRLVQLATMGGNVVNDFNLGKVLMKRITIFGSTLRSRNLPYQIKLTEEFYRNSIEKFNNRSLRPIIDKVFDWKDVQNAHRYMEENKNAGKIILKIRA